jgi:heme-degrading monooxygenase HmoA
MSSTAGHAPHAPPDAILEVAILDVRPGEADAYEAAFREAQRHLAATPGYVGHELRRRTEAPDRYVLLVWWDSVESHEVGFRGSERYEPWRRLLHPFYEPFPTVEHFEPVEGARGEAAHPNGEDA